MARCYLLVCAILNTPSRSKAAPREGLRLIRGMRRALTQEEPHKIAGKMVEHLKSTNWKIERGQPDEGPGAVFDAEVTRDWISQIE
jgi:hypothetical protein